MQTETESRILVLGDNLLARAGLAALLAPRQDVQVVGQVGLDDTLDQQISVYRPDVLLWDFGYTPMVALAALPRLLDADLPLVILLAALEPVRDVLDALVDVATMGYGLLRNQTDADQLTAAVHGVLGGLAILDPLLLAEALPVHSVELPFMLQDDLTPREMEVLQLLAQGLPNKAIAQVLEISPNTVKFHVNAILSKLDAQSRTEAVVRATQLGLIFL